MVVTLTLILALQLGSTQVPAPVGADPTGTWRAWLDSPGGPLPFALVFATRGPKLRAAIVNGSERIEIPIVKRTGRRLTLGFDHYDSEIVAELRHRGTRLEGRWTKRRGGADQGMDFHAEAGAAPRFAAPKREDTAAPAPFPFAGRWRVNFSADKHLAVGVFAHGAGSVVTGTFMTTLGDYRYLAGNRHGTRLQLSCFDGAHAFLFRAEAQAGKLVGEFWSSATWYETWRGTRDSKAVLPDPWKLTTADLEGLGRLRFPDTTGRLRALSEPAFAGKARILVVFGTWCPNCRDETSFLVDLDRRYRARGLSIVGLAFEQTGDGERDRAQLRTYARRQGITFPLLLAGSADKGKASRALPILDSVRAYPTTLFLREDGSVRAVHTGFAGPATGPAHAELRRRFEALITELLGK